jgi:hypothetical protein
MSNDIYKILEKLSVIESTAITPVGIKKGLNPQQKSVPQMPALFKMKSQSPVLGGKMKPHPAGDYMVGDSKEFSTKKSLEETMSEIEEDMLSKVKRDLTHYLDKLEKKNRIDTDLKAKAKDAVIKHRAEEHNSETQDQEPETKSKPVKSVLMGNGVICEIHGNENDGFEIRHGGKAMKSRFKDLDHACLAIEMFNSKLQNNVADESADYMEEK